MLRISASALLLLLLVYVGAFAVPIVVHVNGSRLAAGAAVVLGILIAAVLLLAERKPRAE